MVGPAQNISNAISAYNRALKGEAPGTAAVGESEPKSGEFADLVKSAIREAIEIGKTSETQSMAGIQDKADLNQVVTALAEAEVTLQTVVTVRDKMVEAYKEVLRMTI